MNKKPKIRFKGFTNDWEQRKFGDCFTERIESMPEGELISVTINDGVKKFSELGRYDNSNENKSKYKKVCIGDIAYNSMRMWQGASGYSPYEGIVSPAYTVLAAKAGIDSKCMSYQIKLPNILHIFQINSQGITSDNWILKFPVLKEIKIIVANEPIEQQKIAQFFQNLDKLITLHQRKCEKLKNIKKSLLEKMFPKNNEKIPAIRFKGFTNDWEQCKLGNHSLIKGRLGWKNLRKDEYTTKGACMIAGKHISNGKIDWLNVDHIPQWRYFESPEIMLKNGDIIFSKDGSLGNPALIENLKEPSTINSTMMLIRIINTISPKFLYQIMTSEQFDNLVKLKISGSSIPHLFQADMNEFTFKITNLNEQEKIGELFQNLDKLITLHQRKLEKLQNIKKALLEKMFV